MKVLLHPGDEYGCGYVRLSWPGQYLAAAGRDVLVELPNERTLELLLVRDGMTTAEAFTEPDVVADVNLPAGVDVIVVQRPSHKVMVDALEVIRRKGVAVVVDIDDDMHHIHPRNAAYQPLNPNRYRDEALAYHRPGFAKQHAEEKARTEPWPHSWLNVERACDAASMVVVSTPALLRTYAKHGRGIVVPNYLPDLYYEQPRVDSAEVCWPAVLFSHPDDPAAVGNGIARLIRETHADFSVFGENDDDVRRAFQLTAPPRSRGQVGILDWPATIARIGIGIAPLADSTFNRGKSWLKPLELSAAGVPWVASPRIEYRRLHELGCGLLAEKPADWYRLLRELVRSAGLRQELSGMGRQAADKLRLRDHAEEFWAGWTASVEAHV